ncbi:hypothetical protein GCM10023203_38010 [Actinomycetospora straminea]|uniref:Uncharacterized protein n=1 Tax=Actinomycetospora straminea TaxID=663607 RepID=A0ABP9EMY5_9PSEU
MRGVPSRPGVSQPSRGVSLQRGIDQSLVPGEGLVADGDAHEVARVLDPAVRIAIVDTDPATTAVNHARLFAVPGAAAA